MGKVGDVRWFTTKAADPEATGSVLQFGTDAITDDADQWTIDGTEVVRLTDETRTWQKLNLSFRSGREHADFALRPLEDAAGKYEINEKHNGGYEVVERSGERNEIEMSAPVGRQDLRSSNYYVVDEYEEEMSDPDADIVTTELSLIATEPKDPLDSYISATSTSDEWKLTLADGEVGTDRIIKNIDRGGGAVDNSYSISIILDEEEAMIVEHSLNRQAAVYTRDVPEGPNIVEDTNSDDRNTITIDAPSNRDSDEVILESGTYIVQSWETTLLNDEYFQVDMGVVNID